MNTGDLRQLSMPDMLGAGSEDLYSSQQNGSSAYQMYPQGGPQMPMVPPSTQAFVNPQSSMVPSFDVGVNQQSYPMPEYPRALQQRVPMASGPVQNSLPEGVFSAPFDMGSLEAYNFENHYGAAEFGMLNHMSSSMLNSPPSDGLGTYSSNSGNYAPDTISTAYGQPPGDVSQYAHQQGQAVGQRPTETQPGIRPGSNSNRLQQSGRGQDPLVGGGRHEAPPAFAIGTSSFPSPSSGSSPQGMLTGFDDSPNSKNLYTNMNSTHQTQSRQDPPSHQRPMHSTISASATSTPTLKVQTLPSRRHRNPSTLYDSVKQPYSYTAAFHGLTALIQRRFSHRKTAHIAKALAAIRPSFISCTMKLNKDDLVFMEKCLQRTLWEYEDFISATGTPTIICRRTGEVVAAGKEFSILSGWSKNVLLGREPNLNINTGGGSSRRGGTNSPETYDPNSESPVNIVDLLDDDCACDFFDDYAHLAFGDPRGSVTTPCKLLKYVTASDSNLDDNFDDKLGSQLKRQRDANLSGKGGIRGEAGMNQLGNVEGKVDCMLCWSVKRDVFDIPMLFVMNVSSPLYRPIPPSRLSSALTGPQRSFHACDASRYISSGPHLA